MPISVGDIVNALIALGGEAHASAIADHIVVNGHPPFPADPAASVRARLQENCSDYRAFLGKADLFESERGTGIWRMRLTYPTRTPDTTTLTDRANEFDFDWHVSEGNKVLRQHWQRERSAKLVREFKASLQAKICEACSLDLTKIYGDLAVDYIEAHHRTILSASDGETTSSLQDLAALCPNCHRIIHKNYPMTVDELRNRLLVSGTVQDLAEEICAARLSWRDAMREALKRFQQQTGGSELSRQAFLEAELANIVQDAMSHGRTPAQTASRILQELRDLGEIEFLSEQGRYRIISLK